jgi:hypothetical protein
MLRPQVPRKAFGGRSAGPKGVSSSFATHPTWELNTGLLCNVTSFGHDPQPSRHSSAS